MDFQRKLILHWACQGAIKQSDTQEALNISGALPQAHQWPLFLATLLLWLGALAVTISILFFFAFNWNDMSRFTKFGLLEAGVFGCAALYWFIGSEHFLSKLALTIGSILVGVLLAFYGQTYQTGADPWQLFAYWGLLIIPWALLARFATLWFLIIVLINTALQLYFEAYGQLLGLGDRPDEDVFWIALLFFGTCWLAWEAASTKFTWLNERWAPRLLAIATAAPLTAMFIMVIIESIGFPVLTVILYLAMITLGFTVYQKRIPDLFMLAGFCLSVISTIASVVIAEVLEHVDEIIGFLGMTIFLISMAAFAANWLKKMHQEQSS